MRLSAGIAAHTAPRPHTATVDETITALRALIEHRQDLVRTRTRTINRLHTLLTKLLPAGLPGKLTAQAAATASRRLRPRATLDQTLRTLAVELVAQVRRLDQRIAAVTDQISAAVTASGTTLTELHGIGDLLTAKILPRTTDLNRFRSAAAFASYCGAAPLEASSDDAKRHRLSRHEDRQLNPALHIIGHHPNPPPTLRCLKRRLCDVVYPTMIVDSVTSLIPAA